MATNYTENYQLPIWAADDAFLRTEFNEANEKIDAALGVLAQSMGNCRIVTGSYTGTGEYGSAHPNTLTFDFPPKLVVITVGDAHSVLLSPNTQAAGYHEAYTRYGMLKVTWSGNSVSWYVTGYYNGSLHSTGGDAEHQLNQSGTSYYYLAIG